MAGTLNLSLILKADASQFRAGIGTARAELGGLTQAAQQASSGIGGALQRGAASFGRGLVATGTVHQWR